MPNLCNIDQLKEKISVLPDLMTRRTLTFMDQEITKN